MSAAGYHSPRFSEDNAWLPPWLQPHRCPMMGEQANDDPGISSPACKNCVFIGGSAQQQQSCLNAAVNSGSYSGFHLHLSGDEDTPPASTPTGSNVLPFSMHLSSESAAQLSSAQANDNPPILNSDAFKGLSEDLYVDGKTLEVNHVSQNQLKTKALQADKLVESCKLACKETIKPPGTKRHRRHQLPCGKADIWKLRNAEVDDAVELSIAASEAMVITEMILHGSQSDNLTATAAFEAALRVKEARKKLSFEEPEHSLESSENELDETDWRAELDETEMADAFQDVGLSPTQTTCSYEVHSTSNLKQHNSGPICPPCHVEAHILEACSAGGNEDWSCQEAATDGHVTDSLANHGAACNADTNDHVPDSLANHGSACNADTSDHVPNSLANHGSACNADHVSNSFANQGSACNADTNDHVPYSSANHGSACKLQNGSAPGCGSVRQTAVDKTASCSRQMKIAPQKLTQNNAFVGSSAALVRSQNIHKEDREIAVQRNVGKRTHAQEMFNQETSFLSESMDVMSKCPLTSREEPMAIIASSSMFFPYKNEGSCKANQSSEPLELRNHVVSLSLSLVDPLCSIVPCSISCSEGSTSQMPKCKQTEEEKELIYPKEHLGIQILNGEAGPCCASLAKGEESSLELRRTRYSSLRPFSTTMPTSNILGDAAIEMEPRDIEVAVWQRERCAPIINLNKNTQRVQACNEFLNKNSEGESMKKLSVIQKKSSHFQGSSEHQSIEQQIPLDVCPQATYLHVGKQDLKRKRVQFSESKHCTKQIKKNGRMKTKTKSRWSDCRIIDRIEPMEHIDYKKAIFQGLEFLLTGFQGRKEKEIEALIRKSRGYVLSKVPSCAINKIRKRAEFACWKPPIVLSPKKVSTAKFLYGCATNSWMLNLNWLFDSLQAGVLLPPVKYLIRQRHTLQQSSRIGESLWFRNQTCIFEGVGFLIHGKNSFCSKFSNIIMHGGGQVFVSMHGLVQSLKDGSTSKGIILVANEASASRHLSHCGLEHNIKTVPASWIIGSLFSGKLVPFKKDRCASFHRIKMPLFQQQQAFDMSQEI